VISYVQKIRQKAQEKCTTQCNLTNPNKLPGFCHLLWHLERKRGGFILPIQNTSHGSIWQMTKSDLIKHVVYLRTDGRTAE